MIVGGRAVGFGGWLYAEMGEEAAVQSPNPQESELGAWGILSATGAREIMHATAQRVVLPGLSSFGITAPGWEC